MRTIAGVIFEVEIVVERLSAFQQRFCCRQGAHFSRRRPPETPATTPDARWVSRFLSLMRPVEGRLHRGSCLLEPSNQRLFGRSSPWNCEDQAGLAAAILVTP